VMLMVGGGMALSSSCILDLGAVFRLGSLSSSNSSSSGSLAMCKSGDW